MYNGETTGAYFVTVDQELNNGNTIHISSATKDPTHDTPIYQAGSGGSIVGPAIGSNPTFQWDYGVGETSTLLDLTPYLPTQVTSIEDFNYVFNNVDSNPQPMSYYESDTYIAKKEAVLNKTNWLWGDYDTGGMAALRIGNNYTLFLHTGFFERIDVEGDSKYGFGVFTGSFSYEQLQQCFFYIDGQDTFEDVSGFFEPYCLKIMYRTNPSSTDGFRFGTRVLDLDSTPPRMVYIDPLLTFQGFTAMETTYSAGLFSSETYPEWIAWYNGTQERQFYTENWGGNLNKLSGAPDADMSIDTDSSSNPYSGGGPVGSGGGDGDYPDQSDTSDGDDAGDLTVDALNSGILAMYSPSVSQLRDFNNFLYSTLTESMSATLKKLTSDPMEYLVFLALCHFTPSTPVSGVIKYGGISTEVTAPRINKQFQTIDCGYVDVPNASKSFLDYSPYSRISIYLPYIGIQELSIDECMGSRLRVKYNIDLMTGCCTAYIHISRSKRTNGDANIYHPMYEYQGNCYLQIPMSSTSSRGTIQALQNVMGAVVSGATGNVAGAVSGAIGAVSAEKISVSRGGSMSANYGYIAASQKPFIILERPINSVANRFGSFEGWTSNMYQKVNMLKGYTEIDENTIWTDNFGHATDEEAQMIKDIMNGGVYL